MHLPSRDTVVLCIHLLQTEHDHLVKAGVKTMDAGGEEIEGPIIKMKQAIEDLIRYDAYVVLLQESEEKYSEEVNKTLVKIIDTSGIELLLAADEPKFLPRIGERVYISSSKIKKPYAPKVADIYHDYDKNEIIIRVEGNIKES